ncbi:MAG: HAD hydrolase-like protein [Butyrivibrio sp.]|nr:HAD hydrolase-like protein [Butyrivibrio sp.]
MLKYVLFDLDGTLTESGPGIMNAAKIALNHFGIEENKVENLHKFVGPPLTESFGQRYGMNEADTQEAIAVFRKYYNITGIYENSVFEGIQEMLQQLKRNGLLLSIASSKPRPMIDIVVDHFDIRKYFDVIVGCELDGTRSQKKEVVDEVIRLFGELSGDDAVLEHSIMVGDRMYDVNGARECGLECIGVTYGYGTRQELQEAGAAYIVDSVNELGEKLLHLVQTR